MKGIPMLVMIFFSHNTAFVAGDAMKLFLRSILDIR